MTSSTCTNIFAVIAEGVRTYFDPGRTKASEHIDLKNKGPRSGALIQLSGSRLRRPSTREYKYSQIWRARKDSNLRPPGS